jgi:hypothetical protein
MDEDFSGISLGLEIEQHKHLYNLKWTRIFLELC